MARPFVRYWLLVLTLATPWPGVAESSDGAALTYRTHYASYEAAIEAGDLDSAVVHGRRAYEAARRERGPFDAQTGVLAFNLGVVNLELNRHRDGQKALTDAVAIYAKAYGEDDVRVAKPLVELARAESELADWNAAERSYVRALQILDADDGGQRPEQARILGILTDVADRLEEPQRVRNYGLRGIALLSSTPDADPLELGKLHLAVARSEIILGDVGQAKRHAEAGLRLYETSLPDDDPRLAPAYEFAANIYERAGKGSTARKYRRKASEARGDAD